LLEPILYSFKQQGISPVIYQEGQVDPTNENVMAGRNVYISKCCDIIVAVGGGSRMDLAKRIRLLGAHTEPIEQYLFR